MECKILTTLSKKNLHKIKTVFTQRAKLIEKTSTFFRTDNFCQNVPVDRYSAVLKIFPENFTRSPEKVRVYKLSEQLLFPNFFVGTSRLDVFDNLAGGLPQEVPKVIFSKS